MGYKKVDREAGRAASEAKQEHLKKMVQDLAEQYKTDPSKLTEYLQFSSQFYNYSPKNVAMIYGQNRYASFVQSFADWKRDGHSVLKGEKGLNIFVPVKVTYLQIKEDTWVQLSKAAPEQKQDYLDGKIKAKEKLMFKLGTTFDISQTNFPKERYPELLGTGYQSAPHAKMFEGLKDFAEEHLHCPVSIKKLPGITLRGQYQPYENKITINEILEDNLKFSTLAHEIGHAIAHNVNEKTLGKSLNQIEFEGDALSVMIHQKLGLTFQETNQRHLSQAYKGYVKEIEVRSLKEQQRIKDMTGKDAKPLESEFVIGEAFGHVYTLFQNNIDKIEECVNRHLKTRQHDRDKKIARPDPGKKSSRQHMKERETER